MAGIGEAEATEAGTREATEAGTNIADDLELRRSDRYNLRKRPRAEAHRTWVEEELDSTDPVSYRDAIQHPQLSQK